MGVTKKDRFSNEQNAIADFAKIIGHPARVAILQHLAQRDSCVCGDLVDEIGLAQATISQHLNELKKINLIQGTITGTRICYCINNQTWQQMQTVLSQFLQQKINPNSC